jgi:uncharacterized protein YaiI (UPF0178 family)
MRLLVDADACPVPVLAATRRLCLEFGVPVTTVASFRHDIQGPDHVMVGPESQAADMAIINRTRRGDLVVTQDWGLAALVLAKGATAISPWGHRFRDDEMEGRLAQRAFHARLRRGGVRLSGPAKRTAADDAAFEQALRAALAGGTGAP